MGSTQRGTSAKRITKKGPDPERSSLQLLLVFSLAAWIELSEKWYSMPYSPDRNLPMVCNFSPLRIRAYAKYVHEEAVTSSTPMFDKVCSMCGVLLESSTKQIPSDKFHGVSGKAIQILGEVARWDAMPLFLLLWTPQALAKFLPAVFVFDSSTASLRLKGGLASAPWLHLKRMTRKRCPENLPFDATHSRGLAAEKPWWFCGVCAAYWHSTTAGTSSVSAKDIGQRPSSKCFFLR